MFIITKTFTDDEGHLFTKVNPKQYSTPGEAYDAMRKDGRHFLFAILCEWHRIVTVR